MHLCEKCGGIAYWDSYHQAYICTRGNCGHLQYVPGSNYEMVIRKSPEEMSELFATIAGCPLNVMETCPDGHSPDQCRSAKDCWLAWLRQAKQNESESES